MLRQPSCAKNHFPVARRRPFIPDRSKLPILVPQPVFIVIPKVCMIGLPVLHRIARIVFDDKRTIRAGDNDRIDKVVPFQRIGVGRGKSVTWILAGRPSLRRNHRRRRKDDGACINRARLGRRRPVERIADRRVRRGARNGNIGRGIEEARQRIEHRSGHILRREAKRKVFVGFRPVRIDRLKRKDHARAQLRLANPRRIDEHPEGVRTNTAYHHLFIPDKRKMARIGHEIRHMLGAHHVECIRLPISAVPEVLAQR